MTCLLSAKNVPERDVKVAGLERRIRLLGQFIEARACSKRKQPSQSEAYHQSKHELTSICTMLLDEQKNEEDAVCYMYIYIYRLIVLSYYHHL